MKTPVKNKALSSNEELQLIERCLRGEAQAFERLFAHFRPQLFYYFLLRNADFYEAEDDSQETLISAYENIQGISSKDAFTPWLFTFASQLSQSKLAGKTPWSSDALEILQEQLSEHPLNEKLLQEIYQDYEETYQVIDHILFCFIVMSKTHFAQEQESFLLSELYEFSLEELSAIQGLADTEKQALERKLRETHEDLAQTYLQRCSLVKRDAPCTQCQDFGRWLENEELIATQLENLELQYNEEAVESLDERLDLLRERLKQRFTSPKFHQQLFDFLRLALGEKGIEEEPE